ncbi:hypothetical protein [Ralstonia insidiosa]|uniref:hypothetical protein n=1 Tax=Ralstonia insidiosa TaxID=190721 RepID=UPI000CEE4097|nr:hypothetical protein [Ralstonia insidiosa]
MAYGGALVGGRCYSSPDVATDVYYSSAVPSQTVGSTTYLAEFLKVSGAWVLRRYQVGSDGSLAQLVDASMPAMVFPDCDPYESFKDGMTVGWGVVAAMFLAWGVVYVRRAL